jgi:rubrerythrin
MSGGRKTGTAEIVKIDLDRKKAGSAEPRLYTEQELKEAVEEELKPEEKEVQIDVGKIDYIKYYAGRKAGIEVKGEKPLDPRGFALQIIRYASSQDIDKVWIITSRQNYQNAIDYIHTLIERRILYATVLKKIKYVEPYLKGGKIKFKQKEEPYDIIELAEKVCPHCGYTWRQRTQNPKICPKCRKWLTEEPASSGLPV